MKRILLMPRLHGLGHKHNNDYITVLQQEMLVIKRKKERTRASTTFELQLCLSCLPDTSVRPPEDT